MKQGWVKWLGTSSSLLPLLTLLNVASPFRGCREQNQKWILLLRVPGDCHLAFVVSSSTAPWAWAGCASVFLDSPCPRAFVSPASPAETTQNLHPQRLPPLGCLPLSMCPLLPDRAAVSPLLAGPGPFPLDLRPLLPSGIPSLALRWTNTSFIQYSTRLPVSYLHPSSNPSVFRACLSPSVWFPHHQPSHSALAVACVGSVVSDSLRPMEFCPWNPPGLGCHFLLQGIFPTQRLNPGLLQLLQRQVTHHFPPPCHSCPDTCQPLSCLVSKQHLQFLSISSGECSLSQV